MTPRANREGLGRQAADRIADALALVTRAEEATEAMSRAIEQAEAASLAAGSTWRVTLPAPLAAAHQAYLDGTPTDTGEEVELPGFLDKPL